MTLGFIIVGLSCGLLGFWIGRTMGSRITTRVMEELHELRQKFKDSPG